VRSSISRLKRLEKLLAERDITLTLDDGARFWLGDKGYDPIYGARPLKRVIQKNVQDRLANMILEGAVADGSHVSITGTDLGLHITATEGTGEKKPAAKRSTKKS
jgi:ATP-dependent Clp protease ATP-binding subunit ClpB